MSSPNTIFLNGREYTAEELEVIIAQHELLFNFYKEEHARVNGDES